MNNTKSSIKTKTIQLRKQGKSYNEINKLLGVSKSTLSSWLKDLSLSRIIKKNKINSAKLIWSKNIIKYNKKRSKLYQAKVEKILNKYSKEVPKIDSQALFWIGVALFWAEGGKREKWTLKFVNSDAKMIQIMMKFFRKICKVTNKKIKLRIHLYPNIDESKTKKYWSQITKLSLKSFYSSQTQITKSSKNKRPFNRLPYGTLHISICDTNLVKKMRGWNLGLIKQINNLPG